MDKPKPFTGVLGVVASVLAANAAKGRIQRTPSGTKKARQFAEAKGTSRLAYDKLDNAAKNLPHVGKKQIEKELKRMEKEKVKHGNN